MRITKQRRILINKCKETFEQFTDVHQIAIFYANRYEIFSDYDQNIIPLVEIAINEFVDQKQWRLEFGIELAMMKISGGTIKLH